ncbi:MAG: putative acetolactate synthase large subunit [Chloroflexi bacterium]|nr:putative acetolactate synthase large subunit [Chloroflexota bacterium]
MATGDHPRNGGQALVAALKDHGVDTVFGIPGAHTLAIYDALLDEPDIHSVVSRNEGGAGYMADGYARASGKPGVAITITGPGAINALTAVGGAYSDSSPLLVISSQIPSTHLGAGQGYLHEMRDQLGAFDAATDWTARANGVSEIAPAIDAALHHFRDGRPTPAYLEIPLDVLDDPGRESGAPAQLPARRTVPVVDTAAIERAVALLLAAERPVIYAGWGVISANATAELAALAEALGAPVATSVKGKGAIPDDHPLCLGCAWAAEVRASPALAEADVMLAIGTRFTVRTASWGRVPIAPTLIHLDVDPIAHDRTVPATVALTGDARDTLRQLLERIVPAAGNRPRAPRVWGGYRQEVRAAIDRKLVEQSPFVAETLHALRESLDRDAIVTNDNCLFCFWAGRYLPMYEPRTWQFPMQFCTLGWALPAAIGAKVAHPNRQVVALAGDGGFMFTCQELVTAASLGLNLPIIVFNDAAYGSVRENQTKRYGGRHSGIALDTPDFPRLAEACNARGVRLQHPGELPAALADAFAADRPTLIEFQVTLQFP